MKYFIYFIFILAFFIRLLKLIPNMELVTAAMLFSCLYISRNVSLKLTFLLMAATDLILGNTNIFLFTWTGFLLPIFIICLLPKFLLGLRLELQLVSITGLGIISNLFFYLWTNFGVWLLDSWNMYPKDLPGLIQCYINGLPFLKNQLESTLLFIPLGAIILLLLPRRLAVVNKTRLLYNS